MFYQFNIIELNEDSSENSNSEEEKKRLHFYLLNC